MTYHAAVSFFTSHSANSGVHYTEHADIAEVQHSGGDLAPSLRGTQKSFRGPRFLIDDFLTGKISIFTAKISDDLF